jgi:hypothetical protein
MKIASVNEYGEVVLEEVYNPIILRTKSSVGVISLQPNKLPQLLMVNKLDKDE